ncbi:MAG: caspase family protein [Albidovulum sp.]
MMGLLIVALAAMGGVPTANAAGRVALVIGNSGYADRPLRNPPNDARAMAALLRDKLGFAVTERTDLDLKHFRAEVNAFLDRAKDAELRVIYYSGHGASYDGDNYLLPIGHGVTRQHELPDQAYSVKTLLRGLKDRGGINVVLLDSCRNAPFGDAKSIWDDSKGMRPLQPQTGVLIGYAADAGQTASDNSGGGNSLYTKYLLQQLGQSLELREALKRVRQAVYDESGHSQFPMVEDKVLDDVYLAKASDGSREPPPATTGPVAPVAPIVAVVNGKPISKAALDQYAQQLRDKNKDKDKDKDKVDSPEARKSLVDQLVLEELLVQEAAKLKLADDPQIQQQLAMVQRNLLASSVVRRMLSDQAPSEDAIKKEYETATAAMKDKEYKASHILVDSEDKAKEVIAKLKKGGNFAELAKTKSSDSSAASGGDLGWFATSMMVPPFAQAVAKLKKGQYSEQPVQTPFGWHVILLEDVRDATPPSLDELKPQIAQMLQSRTVNDYLEKLKAGAKIGIKEIQSIQFLPDPVAVVTGKPISKATFELYVQQLRGRTKVDTPESAKALIDQLVLEELLVQEADKQKLAEDPEIKQQLAMIQRNLLASSVVRRMLGEKAPGEDQGLRSRITNEYLEKLKSGARIEVKDSLFK